MAKELAGGRIRFLGSHTKRVPQGTLPEVAVAGRSNVGKSRCLNALVGMRAAARVSRTPGRTQAINLFEIEGRYLLADLPGYGYAKVPEQVQRGWKSLVETYLAGPRPLRLLLLLVDIRRQPGGMDGQLLWGLREARIPVLVLATKADKLTRQKQRRALQAIQREYRLKDDELQAFSAVTRQGLDALKARVAAAVRD